MDLSNSGASAIQSDPVRPSRRILVSVMTNTVSNQRRRHVGRLLLAALFVWIVTLWASPVAAQKKYDPEHPKVLAMIDQAMQFIAEDPSSNFGKNVIYAMAAYKSGIVSGAQNPKEHPQIVETLAMCDRLSESQLKASAGFRAMYASALAAVFLLELDPDKHQAKIQLLLDHISARQQDSGAWGYRDYPTAGDTSQMQYIALALWLAKQNDFKVDPRMCKRALEWMIQWQMDDGGWIYMQPIGVVPSAGTGAREVRHSLVAAGLGTVYLYADTLQLFQRAEGQGLVTKREDFLELPAAVIDVTGEAGAASSTGKMKALVSMDTGSVRSTMNQGNNWFGKNFDVQTERYNMYYLYGFERYISMRQFVDGDVGKAGGMETWYDQGVDFLLEIQQPDGSFRSPDGDIADAVNTAFGVLFLTQSMSITLESGATGLQTGFENFQSNVILQEADDGGGIRVGSVEKSLSDFLDIMDKSETDELAQFADSLLDLDLHSDEVSRGQQLAQLRTLIKHENWKARLIAIRFIGRQRSLDNVPALIFALTDPDPLVVHEANRGMMFVSRKTEGPALSREPTRGERKRAVEDWTAWYKRVKPDAVLLELPEEYLK